MFLLKYMVSNPTNIKKSTASIFFTAKYPIMFRIAITNTAYITYLFCNSGVIADRTL